MKCKQRIAEHGIREDAMKSFLAEKLATDKVSLISIIGHTITQSWSDQQRNPIHPSLILNRQHAFAAAQVLVEYILTNNNSIPPWQRFALTLYLQNTIYFLREEFPHYCSVPYLLTLATHPYQQVFHTCMITYDNREPFERLNVCFQNSDQEGIISLTQVYTNTDHVLSYRDVFHDELVALSCELVKRTEQAHVKNESGTLSHLLYAAIQLCPLVSKHQITSLLLDTIITQLYHTNNSLLESICGAFYNKRPTRNRFLEE